MIQRVPGTPPESPPKDHQETLGGSLGALWDGPGSSLGGWWGSLVALWGGPWGPSGSLISQFFLFNSLLKTLIFLFFGFHGEGLFRAFWLRFCSFLFFYQFRNVCFYSAVFAKMLISARTCCKNKTFNIQQKMQLCPPEVAVYRFCFQSVFQNVNISKDFMQKH